VPLTAAESWTNPLRRRTVPYIVVFLRQPPGDRVAGTPQCFLEVVVLAELVIALLLPKVFVLTDIRKFAQPFPVSLGQRELDMVGPCLHATGRDGQHSAELTLQS